MKVINIYEAKTHLSKYLELVARGEEVVIGKYDKPVARLVPFETAKSPRVPGILKGKIWMSPDFDAPIPEFEASINRPLE